MRKRGKKRKNFSIIHQNDLAYIGFLFLFFLLSPSHVCGQLSTTTLCFTHSGSRVQSGRCYLESTENEILIVRTVVLEVLSSGMDCYFHYLENEISWMPPVVLWTAWLNARESSTYGCTKRCSSGERRSKGRLPRLKHSLKETGVKKNRLFQGTDQDQDKGKIKKTYINEMWF